MKLSFRQGIVSYPSSNGVQQFLIPSINGVTLSTTNGVVDVAFAHRDTNYLFTESVTTVNAWSGYPASTLVWLYWDINTLTAVRTFGYTTVQPVVQSTPPTSPQQDQHWFDTSKSIMKVWNRTQWVEKIRVFAARYNSGTFGLTSVSNQGTSQRFDGTQIGSVGVGSSLAGRIIADDVGQPVISQTGTFFTTETDFFVNGSPVNTIRLEANILTATAYENIAAYQVVKFRDFGVVQLASYDDIQTTSIAIAMQDVLMGEVGSFVTQGIITNKDWDWQTVNQTLWVLQGGTLVSTDPHVTDAITYQTGKPPIGRVIDHSRIIFDQGLGGKGDKGDSAIAGSSSGAATQYTLGTVKLSCAPTDAGSPYAVETNDPRMSDARRPLQHTHPASDIIPIANGNNVSSNLQTTLLALDSNKVSILGDTMQGPLVLSGDPTQPLQAVTKRYVDTFVPLSQKGTAGGVATLGTDGKIPDSQLPKLSISDTFVVGSEADMLLLSAQTGDLAVRTDTHDTYILKGTDPTQLSSWQELLTKPDGVTWIDVVPAAGEQGLTTSGGPITASGQITLSLAGDVKAIEALTGTGVAHRTGVNTWEVKAVDLGSGGNVVAGVLPVGNGGTGLSNVVGYIKGTGSSFQVLSTIPGSDVSGAVPLASSVPWLGVTNTPTTLAGYGITDAYTKTQTNALTWNWSSITNTPTTLAGYGITDAYTKTQTDALLSAKANKATTLAGYGITDAASINHNHTLDSLANVDTTGKASGHLLQWNGLTWKAVNVGNALLPSTISGKTIDDSNVIFVKSHNFTIEDDADVSKQVQFRVNAVSPNTVRLLTVPNADGTIALTNGFGATGNWNITASAASSVPWLGVTNTPTTLAGYGITDAYTKTQTNALTWNWSSITNTPTTLAGYGITDAYTNADIDMLLASKVNAATTLAGYGITDAYTKTQTNALTWNWSSITNTPTTLAGYGITDAAPINHNHDGVYVKLTSVGVSVAGLDQNHTVPVAQLPQDIYTHTYTATSDTSMTSLIANVGDLCVRTDLYRTYCLSSLPASTLANWTEILSTSTRTASTVVQALHGFTAGQAVRLQGTQYVLAQADTQQHSLVVGVVTRVIDANTFVIVTSGMITTGAYTSGSTYYLSDVTAGLLTTTAPTTLGSISKPVILATSATTGVVCNWSGVAVTQYVDTTALQSAVNQLQTQVTSLQGTVDHIRTSFPYDMSFSMTQPVGTTTTIGVVPITRQITIPASCVGSLAKALTNPTTSSSKFNVISATAGATVASVTISPTGTITFATITNSTVNDPNGNVVLPVGDIVTVVTDSTTYDSTINLVGINIMCYFTMI